MDTMFKEMHKSIQGQCVRGLTGEKANALHRNLVGVSVLIFLLLKKGYVYVLLGKFSSNRIEAEFGLCRPSRRGTYLIGAKQVINSVKLQRLKLYSKLDVDSFECCIIDDCCTIDLKESEVDLDLIDNCFADASNLSVNVVDLSNEAELTLKVLAGKLRLPSINLYDFSQ